MNFICKYIFNFEIPLKSKKKNGNLINKYI